MLSKDSEPKNLIITLRNGGFFSNFNCVMTHLFSSIKNGIAAIKVSWMWDDSFDGCPYGTSQDGNLWEIFFEPLKFNYIPKKNNKY